MGNHSLFGYVAIAAILAGMSLGAAAPARALTMKECSAKYQAAQADGTLKGQSWNDFRKAQCGADAAAAPAPAAAVAAAPAKSTPPAAAPAPTPPNPRQRRQPGAHGNRSRGLSDGGLAQILQPVSG